MTKDEEIEIYKNATNDLTQKLNEAMDLLKAVDKHFLSDQELQDSIREFLNKMTKLKFS